MLVISQGPRNDYECEDLLEKGTRQKGIIEFTLSAIITNHISCLLESTTQRQLTRILVMANSYDNNGYRRSIAFCLANTLKSAPDFQVACNLWMAEDLAGKGAASWAHDVITTNDVIVLLCNGDKIEQSASDSPEKPDAYTQLIKSLLNNVSYDKTKLLIACVEDVSAHSCFNNINVASLRRSKSYNIAYSINELLTVLSSKAMAQNQKDEMNSMYAQSAKRLHQKYHHERVITTSLLDDSAQGNASLYDKRKTYENFCHRKHKDQIDKHRRRNRSESASSGRSEHQFDSVYSSQCNSRTTISMTSEDTGYFDHSQPSDYAGKSLHHHGIGSLLTSDDVLEELEQGV